MIQSVAAPRAFERTEYCHRNGLVSGFRSEGACAVEHPLGFLS